MQRPPLYLTLLTLASTILPGTQAASMNLDVTFPSSFDLDPVDPSFLGLSMEPLRLATNFSTRPEFVNLIKHLASFDNGPFNIRWGGNSQDTLDYVLPDQYWEELWYLHNETGCQYTIGLNLLSQDVDLAEEQLTNALSILPPEAVYSIEVGNEPDRFENLHSDRYPDNYMTIREGGWYDDQMKFIERLAPIAKEKLGTTKVFTGPGISDISNWRTEFINKWFREFSEYAKGVSCHWYATKSTYSRATFATLFSDTMTRVTATNGGRWARLADNFNATYRFSETNTFSLGGKAGVSDTLGAAVFIVDYAMSNIEAGIHGMNLHMGACSPYSAIMLPIRCDNAGCVQYCDPLDFAQARAPYMGMWAVQKAIEGLPKRMTRGVAQSGNSKVKNYEFYHAESNELRIVLVQKHEETDDITLEVRSTVSSCDLLMLSGKNQWAKTPNLTFAGQRMDDDGLVEGEYAPIELRVTRGGGVSKMSFEMPSISAAVVICKLG